MTMKGFYLFSQFAVALKFQKFSYGTALRRYWMLKRRLQTGEMEVADMSASQLSSRMQPLHM
jgi:hypothetical protein